jgi:hypothetical protein
MILKTVVTGEVIYKVANEFDIENIEIYAVDGGELLEETPELLALCAAEPETPAEPEVPVEE